MQPQGHVQVLLNQIVFGLNPQEALDAPRVCVEPAGSRGVDDSGSSTVFVEEGMDKKVVEQLEKMGHSVAVVEGYERGLFGRGQVVRWTEEQGRGVWSAGSDMRGDGMACPL